MDAGDRNAELPLDSDSDESGPGTAAPSAGRGDGPAGELPGSARDARPARPLHLRLGFLALVAAGGIAGTAARIGVTLIVDQFVDTSDGSFPIAIFGINIVGAFVLGLLLERLALRGPDVGARRIARLLVGTGVLGGFTTYSALSADSAEILTDGGFLLALVYGVATVLVGALASWAGIALGAHGSRRGGAPDTVSAATTSDPTATVSSAERTADSTEEGAR